MSLFTFQRRSAKGMPAEGMNGEIAGSWLRRQRKARGLWQEKLAARSGLSVRAISDLERGSTRRPYPRTIRVLADALGVADGGPGVHGEGHGRAEPAVPQQLPPAVRHFAGREREFDLAYWRAQAASRRNNTT